MSPFRLTPTPTFKRRRRKKTQQMKDSIDDCIKQLAANPRHPGLHTHRVQGAKGVWESYVDGANRITWHYGENDDIVLRNNCVHDMPGQNP